jgi:exonuclease SbcC
MRIERIELENWMSFPRRWISPHDPEGIAQTVPTIDLSGQPLILISGDNGAGKSAILEAICYALFAKYARGKNQDAIRSGETTAKVRLHISLPAATGITYCVERILSRTSGGTNALLTRLQPDGSAITLVSGQAAVNEYVVERLLAGVDYGAFVSTVFLRQEEAGTFMGLTHAKQREQLLRLCRLDVYKQIFERARNHRKELARHIESLQQQLGEVEYATSDHLSSRRREAQDLKTRRDGLSAEERDASQLLADITRATRLARQIDEGQKRLLQWTDILQHAEEIRHANHWVAAWERVRSSLTQGAQLFDGLETRQAEIELAEGGLTSATQYAETNKRDYDALKAEHERRQKDLNNLRDALPELVARRNSAERELEEAEEAKRLDGLIARILAEQDKREAKLLNFEEVKQKTDYGRLLAQADNTLRFVLEALDEAEDDVATAAAKDSEAKGALGESAQITKSIEEQQSARAELLQHFDNLRDERDQLQRKYVRAQETLGRRDEALQAGVCPTCGAKISGDLGRHVCEEIDALKLEIAHYTERLQSIDALVEVDRVAWTELDTQLEDHEKRKTALENEAKRAREDAESARQRAEQRRQRAMTQWQEHHSLWRDSPMPGWLRVPSAAAQQAVDRELGELMFIEDEYTALTEVRATYQSEASALAEHEQSRANLDVTSPVSEPHLAALRSAFTMAGEQLQQAKSRRDQVKRTYEQVDTRLREAKRELTAAEQTLSKADRKLADLRAAQDQDQRLLINTKNHLEEEQSLLASDVPDLSVGLLDAIENSDIREGLESLASEYGQRASQLSDLQEAEENSTRVGTEIDLLQRELGGLQVEIGPEAERAANERCAQLANDLTQADAELLDLERQVGIVESHHKQRQTLGERLSESRKEAWAFRTIEEAVAPGTSRRAPGPLLALVTQKLMTSIATEASHILDELDWPIRLGYDDDSGFSIEDRALSASRQYKEFSGGERFSIAIAVALAIGRVTHGAGNIRCLFVDEGFGALDQKHRRRIIDDAIGRLIEIGTRDQVVVISHLTDLQDCFPSRIELRRDVDRSALALPSEELA